MTDLETKVKELEAEIADAHKRVNLSNLRVALLEHYLGMRRHKFKPRDKRWRYHQVLDDVRKGEAPNPRESLHREKT